MKAVGVIPSRFGSVRYPGKPLALLQGKPLILHVVEQARRAESLEEVIVATDDERIAEVVRSAQCAVRLTSPACATGSDRVAEVACGTDWEIVVNIQGDEPRLDPKVIDRVVEGLVEAPDCGVSTAMVAIRDREDFFSDHVVKVVCDEQGRALYFSRSPLPSPRRLEPSDADAPDFRWGMKHLGLYAFRNQVLMDFTRGSPSCLEQHERLEQLRLLERGVKIRVVEVEHDSIGVDTPEEMEQLNLILMRAS